MPTLHTLSKHLLLLLCVAFASPVFAAEPPAKVTSSPGILGTPASAATPTPATETAPYKSNLTPFSVQERGGATFWGYRGVEGELVIEPEYLRAGEMTADGAIVESPFWGWGRIDAAGKILARQFAVDNIPEAASEGLIRFWEGTDWETQKMGFLDGEGQVAVAPSYPFATPFSEGLSAACTGCRKSNAPPYWTVIEGKWGYMNKKGETVVPFTFDHAEPFKDGHAKVQLGKRSFFIDASGAEVKP